MVTLPSVGGLARQYLASFEGDDFIPKTLEQAGLLSDAGKTLMASIPATNLAVQTQAMKSAFDQDKQDSINETLLSVQELKNEQAKKTAILNQLATPMAGTALTNFLSGGVGNNMANSLEQMVQGAVLGANYGDYPKEAIGIEPATVQFGDSEIKALSQKDIELLQQHFGIGS
tara:strand:+ start:279 stop:797 length:519 start_codon:yes stop_codon:yes gene_type:complete